MGKTEKKRKENHATKVTKIPRTKRGKHGMNKTSIKPNHRIYTTKVMFFFIYSF